MPSETDETTYHLAGDFDQPHYSHYLENDDVTPASTRRPLSGQREARYTREPPLLIQDDQQDDLGFVDVCESDIEDGGLLLPGIVIGHCYGGGIEQDKNKGFLMGLDP